MTSAEVWKTWEGRTVDGKFPLRQWLGGSEHSAVFLTERPGQGPEKAALKLVPADAGDADRQLARWRAAAQLSHPHLIRIFETGRCGLTLLYVVMEYAEEDLSQILPQRALTSSEVADLLPPMLDALAYVHEKGFVHGRIRPSNVLAVGDQLKLTSDRVVSNADGSPRNRQRDVYDAPETAAGIISPASDLWSVGATLVAALLPSTPFTGEGSQGDPGVPKTMPEPFRGIARECLRFDPKRRCSVAEILARLQPPARSVPVQPEPPAVPRRGVNLGPIAVAVLVVALLVGLVFFFSRGKGGPSQPAVTAQHPAPATPPASGAPRVPTPPTPKPAEAPKPASPGEVVRQVLPEVSPGARRTIRGKIRVVVRVAVDAMGKVTDAKLTSAGPSRYFASQALRAAQQWEFSPPEGGGQPTTSAWVLTFRIGRKGTQVSAQKMKR